MNNYKFMATAICPHEAHVIRDFYRCTFKTREIIAISDIRDICEEYVMERLYQETLAGRISDRLPPGELKMVGIHFAETIITDRQSWGKQWPEDKLDIEED